LDTPFRQSGGDFSVRTLERVEDRASAHAVAAPGHDAAMSRSLRTKRLVLSFVIGFFT
jgi:hypothetical protein